MTTFIAIYRGRTIAEAQLITVSADLSLVSHVSSYLLQKEKKQKHEDEIIQSIAQGRNHALSKIKKEASLTE